MNTEPPDIFTDAAEVVDRSTLERWAVCPHQAWHCEHGVKSCNDLMATGAEVHRVIAQAVKLRQEIGAPPSEVRDSLTVWAMESRPDVQPRVAHVIRKCNYPLTRLFCFHANGDERHPDDLLAYDGGEVDRSGQMAADLTVGETTYRLTCEVDLLMATASEAEIDVTDYKSGWKHWTATEVYDAFQFQFYSWVLFYKFPAVSVIRFTVFMCGEGYATSPVEFRREDMLTVQKRLTSALTLRAAYMEAEKPELVEAWPSSEKCAICPAAARCSIAGSFPDADVAVAPDEYLNGYIATSARADQMKAHLTTFVRQRGDDLVVGENAFGSNRPTAPRARPMDSYQIPHTESCAEAPEKPKRPRRSKVGA